MAESDELFNEVAQLRDEVEEQGAMIGALVHIGGHELRNEILQDMDKDRALREVYLLVDGKRTQGEIAADLDTRGIAKKSAVSLKFEKLAEDYGLIQHVRRAKAGKIYRRTRLAKTLKIDRRLDKAKPGKTST
ncbi:MAG: hypothetical protein H0U46_01435 [Actinobacteria bacterium]|nr:hypothetical protein [Actinomycetota bacterium]